MLQLNNDAEPIKIVLLGDSCIFSNYNNIIHVLIINI